MFLKATTIILARQQSGNGSNNGPMKRITKKSINALKNELINDLPPASSSTLVRERDAELG